MINTRCRAWLDQLSTNSAKPAREGFVSMCACTEPVRTGIGAVCVEYGRPKWPITMLNQTRVQKNVFLEFIFGTLRS